MLFSPKEQIAFAKLYLRGNEANPERWPKFVSFVNEDEARCYYIIGKQGYSCNEKEEIERSLICRDSFRTLTIYHDINAQNDSTSIDNTLLQKLENLILEDNRLKIKDAKIKHKSIEVINGRPFALLGVKGVGLKKDKNGQVVGAFEKPYSRFLAVGDIGNTLVYFDFEDTFGYRKFTTSIQEYLPAYYSKIFSLSEKNTPVFIETFDIFQSNLESMRMMYIEEL